MAEEIIELARREAWSKPGVVCGYFISDFIRRTHSRADELRRYVTRLGLAAADWTATWRVLGHAADLEREAHRREAELDDILEPRA